MGVRGAVRVLGATTATLLLLAGVAGLVLAGTWWAAPAPGAVPPVTVDVAAGRTTLVCPGPPTLAAEDAVTTDPGFDPTPQDTTEVVAAATFGRDGGRAAPGRYLDGLLPDGASTPLAPVGGPAATLAVTDVARSGVLEAEPVDDVRALAVAASLARTGAGDLRGLAGATCLEPAASAWLVAGSTAVGSSARLVVANPGATPATVRLALWGAAGPVDPGQAGTLLVPPGTEQSVLLEGVAPDQSRLALHLEASGGQVAAWVQDSSLRGFVATGTDLAPPVAEPATAVVVPGLLLPESAIDDVDAALLRVVNPGSAATTVSLRLLGPAGEVSIPGAEEVLVEAGSVTDVSLAGVPAGAYAAELVADTPVTAAGMLVRVGLAGPDAPDVPVVDRAWTASTTARTTALLALPDVAGAGEDAAVLLTNAGDAEVVATIRSVRVDAALGEEVSVPVPARSTVVVDPGVVAGAFAMEVTVPGEGALRAVAVMQQQAEDGQLVAVLAAQGDLAAGQSVDVRLDVP